MSFQPDVGKNMKFYRNTGTYGTPVWDEVSEIGDLNISDLSRGLAELKRRANGFVKNIGAFINSISIEFKLIFGLGTLDHTYLRTAFFAGTAFEVAVMNDDIEEADSEGLRVHVIIEQFPWNQPLEQVSDHDVRLATSYYVSGSEIDPAWMVVVAP